MPQARAEETTLAHDLSSLGVYVYAHTINESEEYDLLKEKGVKGIYTDTLF